MRSLALLLPLLLPPVWVVGSGAACQPGTPQGIAVETGFAGGSPQYGDRDDYAPTGHYLDTDGLISETSELLFLRDGFAWDAELSYLWHTGSTRSYAFRLGSTALAIPLGPGTGHVVQLALTDPTGPAGRHRVLTAAEVWLHPDTLIVPVVVWNLGGAVARVDEKTARLMLDRAEGTEFPAGLDLLSWGRQRVDEVWAACHIQFRLVSYQEQWLAGECWQRPPVSNQDPFFQKCVTNRPACTAQDPATQDFGDCTQQEVNRCTLRELLDWSMVSPAYAGPDLYAPDAVNVYIAAGFHLWENLTAGIGCRGEVPFVALSDTWSDSSGLRLAHELGHVMGWVEHTPDTVMGDTSERNATVTADLCEQTRAYLMDHYPWVR
ncbi:MAG: hypothetical protein ABI333_02740 [bacterium]